MDPYIEQAEIWTDSHRDLAGEIRTRLNESMSERYFARLTPWVTYEAIGIGVVQGMRPDVGVWGGDAQGGGAAGGVATIAPAPAESDVPSEVPLTLYRVEIRTVGLEQLVAVIEIPPPQ
jgi:hypothetical protein